MYLKLAWRNLWRNKRRTLITLASVFFAVVLSTLMMSFKEGVYEGMIESMIGNYAGYARIQGKAYEEDKVLDNGFVLNDSLRSALDNTPELRGYAPRIESFALGATAAITKGLMVVGMEPEKEAALTGLDQKIIRGKYLEKGDDAVLIGAGLSEYLEAEPGDTIVLLGMGYHGQSAAGKYQIKGIIQFGPPALSKQLVMMPAKTAQELYGSPDMYTGIALFPTSESETGTVMSALSIQGTSDWLVKDWEELNPEIVNMIATDRVEGYVFMAILYMVISFGFFGTILMMMAERMHEFGVLIAIGMKRIQLAIVVFLEVVIISFLGALSGILGALPLCAWFHYNPIRLSADLTKMMEDYGIQAVLSASISPIIFIEQAAVIFLIACIVSIYPFSRLLGLNALNAMRT